MKDEHNVILILVSSKWLIPSSGVRSWYQILGSKLFIFSFRSSKLFQLYHFKASSKSLQGFTLCSQLLFLSIILLLPEFFMEALHGASSRIPFILQLFFKISLEVMIRQAIPKDKHGAQQMLCFQEFKHSSSCIPKCNSFYLISWDGVMSLLAISPRVFDSQVIRNEIFKPIILFIGVILGYISPKVFPKDFCYLWCS